MTDQSETSEKASPDTSSSALSGCASGCFFFVWVNCTFFAALCYFAGPARALLITASIPVILVAGFMASMAANAIGLNVKDEFWRKLIMNYLTLFFFAILAGGLGWCALLVCQLLFGDKFQ